MENAPWRYYPHGKTGSHLIGFVGFNDEKEFKGQYGLENTYDEDLNNSDDIVTSVDIHVQERLEDVLEGLKKDFKAQKAGGLVINPKTGAIIAMGSVPTFDSNDLTEVDTLTLTNPLIEDRYEIGSTFKPITIAIGLNSKQITPDFKYNDTGTLTIDTEVISNYDKKGRGPNTDLQKILSQSLNTGVVEVLNRTGISTYSGYMSAFKFDEPTKIDLPREIRSDVANLKSTRDIEFATASYGHGIAVTTNSCSCCIFFSCK